jgi:hypothetical protein
LPVELLCAKMPRHEKRHSRQPGLSLLHPRPAGQAVYLSAD